MASQANRSVRVNKALPRTFAEELDNLIETWLDKGEERDQIVIDLEVAARSTQLGV